jgi:hypothetical protein
MQKHCLGGDRAMCLRCAEWHEDLACLVRQAMGYVDTLLQPVITP